MSEYYYSVPEFIYIPKSLLVHPGCRLVSNEGKLLYSIILGQLGSCRANGWIDDLGRAYVILQLDELSDLLSCTNARVDELLAELESQELLERANINGQRVFLPKNFENI